MRGCSLKLAQKVVNIHSFSNSVINEWNTVSKEMFESIEKQCGSLYVLSQLK